MWGNAKARGYELNSQALSGYVGEQEPTEKKPGLAPSSPRAPHPRPPLHLAQLIKTQDSSISRLIKSTSLAAGKELG